MLIVFAAVTVVTSIGLTSCIQRYVYNRGTDASKCIVHVRECECKTVEYRPPKTDEERKECAGGRLDVINR
jgi:hypothetical protein